MSCTLPPIPLMGRFDPRSRLVACVVLIFTLAVLSSLWVSLAALIVAAIFRLCLPMTKFFVKRWISVNVFVGLLWLLTPWSTPGEAWAHWGPITITHAGVTLTALLTLKCNAIFFTFDVFLVGMTPTALARAMTGLKFPPKLTTLILLTARQIDGFTREKVTLEQAAKLRGFEPKFSMHTYKTIASLVGILMLGAYQKSRELTEALKLHGFTGQWSAVHFHKLRARDWALILLSFVLVAVLAVGNFYFPGGL